MNRILLPLFFLYFTACLSSMAAMEILSWLIALFAILLGVLNSKSMNLRYSIGPDRALIILLLVTIVGGLFNTYGIDSFVDVIGKQRWVLLFYLLVFSTIFFKNPFPLDRFYKLVLVISLIVSVYSIFQHFSGIDIIRGSSKVLHVAGRDSVTGEVNRWRATGFFGSPMTYGYSFGLTFFLLFGMVLGKSEVFIKNKTISVIILLLSVAGLVVSYQRGVWLSIVVAAFLGLVVLYISGKKVNWKIVLSFLLVFILPFGSKNFRSRLMAVFDSSSRSVLDRINLWHANWEMFLDSPVWGVGYGENEVLANLYLSKIGVIDGFAGHAHNTFIHYLSGTGLVGFIAFIVFVVYFLFLSVSVYKKARKKDKNIAGFALGAFCAQIFLHTGGLTECNFKDAEVNHQFILILVLLVYFSRILSDQYSPSPINKYS